jgi:hypothetical protein
MKIMPKANVTHEQARELISYAVLQKDSPYHQILERFMASPEDARVIASEMAATIRPTEDSPLSLINAANEQWLYHFMGRHSQYFAGILPITQKEASQFLVTAMFKNEGGYQSILEKFMIDQLAAKTIAAAIHEFLDPDAAPISLVNPMHYQWLNSFMNKYSQYFSAEDRAEVSKRAASLGTQADSAVEARDLLRTAAAEEVSLDEVSADQRRRADAASFAAMRAGQDSFFSAAARRADAAIAVTQAPLAVQAEEHEAVEQRSETAAKR